MGINIIKNEITILLETLTEQYVTISETKDKIPQIELDIMLANIRKLYERLSDLNRLNAKERALYEEKPVTAEEQTEENPPIPVNTDILIQENEVVETIKVETKEIAPTVEQVFDPVDVPEVKTKYDIKPNITEPPKKPVKSKKTDGEDLFSVAAKETIADKFKEGGQSMHEKIIKEKSDQTIAEKISRASIKDLKSTIGLNDKFLFINELFKGDIQEYNKAIDMLNMASDLEQTNQLLNDYKAKLDWQNKPDAYQKLEDLIIRKFL